MSRGLMLIALVMFVFGWFSNSTAANNNGTPLYDVDRNPVSLGAYLGDSLQVVRWVQEDSMGSLIVNGSLTFETVRLYPYFTSGVVDTTATDSLVLFPLPVVSFWLRNCSSADTLYISWRGPSYPASYITIDPLQSFGLENISRPDSLNGLYLNSSVDSLRWELVVLSDSLFI